LNRFSKIWNQNDDATIDEDQLLAYIEGRLSPADQHALEEVLDADPFLNDAVEGLAEVKDKEHLKQITTQINLQLRRQIKSRKQKRRAGHKLDGHWGWLYVLIVLILVLLAWWVIKMMVK
jgi:anti-sigma factor RsiW